MGFQTDIEQQLNQLAHFNTAFEAQLKVFSQTLSTEEARQAQLSQSEKRIGDLTQTHESFKAKLEQQTRESQQLQAIVQEAEAELQQLKSARNDILNGLKIVLEERLGALEKEFSKSLEQQDTEKEKTRSLLAQRQAEQQVLTQGISNLNRDLGSQEAYLKQLQDAQKGLRAQIMVSWGLGGLALILAGIHFIQ